MIKSIHFLLILLLLSGCQWEEKDPLRVSANLWVGYTPLFYIKERGWLEKNNIKLVNVVSLYENMQMYAVGNANVFSGTQYEYHQMKKTHTNLTPIILLDRSEGGDMIMANRSLKALSLEADPIDVYLEVDSVNSEFFQAFITQYALQQKKFHFINLDPESISKIPMANKTSLVVTYTPYDTKLKEKGYQTLCSSREIKNKFVILDALYTDTANLQKYKKEIHVLNKLIAKALHDLQTDPKKYYYYVRYYLAGQSYQSFLDSLKGIDWIYRKREKQLLKTLQSQKIETDYLLKAADAI